MQITRRAFLGGTALSAACAWTPGRATALRRYTSANDKIVLGFIGVGGMGRAHFDRLLFHPAVHIAAIADPDAQRRLTARNKAAGQGQTVADYNDFREMIDAHPQIDAVFIATPDHWHAPAAIHGLERGLDVYCEKPLALTIAEGRQIVETAHRHDRVVQVGTQQRSSALFQRVRELVRDGEIGEIERVVCFFGVNPHAGRIPDATAPSHLDWETYLGPAPWRPYNPLIHPYNFRYFRAFSGGLIADWGVHLFDFAHWTLDKDRTGPRRIEAESEPYRDNLYEFPRECRVWFDYGNVQLEWRQSARHDIEPGQQYGIKFYGTEGEVCVNRGGYWGRRKDGLPLRDLTATDVDRRDAYARHHDDFFDAMRTRRAPRCDAETGHRATTVAHLGNIAMDRGRPLTFNPEREVLIGDNRAEM